MDDMTYLTLFDKFTRFSNRELSAYLYSATSRIRDMHNLNDTDFFFDNHLFKASEIRYKAKFDQKNYKSFIPKIKNSGSICLGKYAVMAMTDYNIGSNHVLPTNTSARYASGISVNEFCKRISYINLSKKGIETLGPSVITLANYEGLVGHAQSVKNRIRRK